MVIKILGTGCANCKRAKAVAAEVIEELQVEATLQEITDISKIMSYGVMSTPAVVIDEQVVASGGVPSRQQMIDLITQT